MDKFEYNVRVEKLKRAVEAEDYAEAAAIADAIDWSKESNQRLLGLVASAYEAEGRYQDAKDVLMVSYERSPVGRRLLYQLTEISVKERNFRDAAMFYKEYMEVAPNDLGKYILRYKIAEGRGEPLEDQIAVLEAYKDREFDEKWAYELATLYHKAGRREDCVRLCDDIILWFGFGPYVEKAMDLKTIYEPLTPSQMERAEHPEDIEEKMREVAASMEGQYDVPVAVPEAEEAAQEAAPEDFEIVSGDEESIVSFGDAVAQPAPALTPEEVAAHAAIARGAEEEASDFLGEADLAASIAGLMAEEKPAEPAAEPAEEEKEVFVTFDDDASDDTEGQLSFADLFGGAAAAAAAAPAVAAEAAEENADAVVETVEEVVETAGERAEETWHVITEPAQEAAQEAEERAQELWSAAEEPVAAVEEAAEEAAESAVETVEEVVETAGERVEDTWRVIAEPAEEIGEGFADEMAEVVGEPAAAAQEAVSEAAENAGEAVSAVTEAAEEAAAEPAAAAEGFAREMAEAVAAPAVAEEAVSETAENVEERVEEALREAAAAAQEAAGEAAAEPAAAAGGFAREMAEAVAAPAVAEEAVSETAENVEERVEEALREATEAAQETAEETAEEAHEFVQAAEETAAAVTGTAEDRAAEAWHIIDEPVQAVGEAAEETAETAEETAEEMIVAIDAAAEAAEEAPASRFITVFNETEEGGLRAAAELLKAKNGSGEPRKAAKVLADRLNEIGLERSMEKLVGADLVVLHASTLSDVVLNEIVKMREVHPEMKVVLTDREETLTTRLQIFEEMREEEARRVAGLPPMRESRAEKAEKLGERNAFLRRVRTYAEQIECSFDDGALEYVEEIAKRRQERGESLMEEEAENLVERAADAAEARRKLFEKKYDKKGYLILRRINFEAGER
ncbi:MAG: hypothetical protein IJL66_05615 [Lachnospiraceae bacterium]|nr:hypothetical protein [Lachnospiraceae bacterium]